MTTTYQEDPVGYAQRLDAKLKPEHIRSTLAFAGLYQITHEQIKHVVLEKVREYYCPDSIFGGRPSERERREYEQDVLRLAPGDRFRASLLWLVNLDAITLTQADRLGAIYAHRHELTHKLIRYVIDPDIDPDIALLIEALEILKAVHRFWIEANLGVFVCADGTVMDDVDPEDVKSAQWLMLQTCLRAYLDGLPAEGGTWKVDC